VFAEHSPSIAKNPSLREALTARAEKVLMTSYSSEVSIAAFERIIRSVVDRSPEAWSP
jgi:hypothetical protein